MRALRMSHVRLGDSPKPRHAPQLFSRFMQTTQQAVVFVEARLENDDEIEWWLLHFVSAGQLFDPFLSDVRVDRNGNIARTHYLFGPASVTGPLALAGRIGAERLRGTLLFENPISDVGSKKRGTRGRISAKIMTGRESTSVCPRHTFVGRTTTPSGYWPAIHRRIWRHNDRERRTLCSTSAYSHRSPTIRRDNRAHQRVTASRRLIRVASSGLKRAPGWISTGRSRVNN